MEAEWGQDIVGKNKEKDSLLGGVILGLEKNLAPRIPTGIHKDNLS